VAFAAAAFAAASVQSLEAASAAATTAAIDAVVALDIEDGDGDGDGVGDNSLPPRAPPSLSAPSHAAAQPSSSSLQPQPPSGEALSAPELVLAADARDEATMDNIRAANIDTVRCLLLAMFVNAAILITAAAAFHEQGFSDVATLEQAHELLLHVVRDGRAAAILFGVALLASGQSSTITGTLAGQIVMQGFLQIKAAPNLRRVVTRLIAVVPAAITAATSGDQGINSLLIVSQVVLSFQLPFAVIPLMQAVCDEELMGARFAVRGCSRVAGWLIAALIIGLNGYLVFVQFS
jgi:Mn2+/Fe2+ NRAMP family transporter